MKRISPAAGLHEYRKIDSKPINLSPSYVYNIRMVSFSNVVNCPVDEYCKQCQAKVDVTVDFGYKHQLL